MPPPKPRLVLRIGVTGHRPNRFPLDAQAIVAAKLDALFAQLADAATDLHRQHADVFAPEPPQFRIVSALAEGADRVVAHAGLRTGMPLEVVLPFPADDYADDFSDAASRAEFRALLEKAKACFVLPGMRSPDDMMMENRAYEAVGLITLRQIDIVVSVWDGKYAAGRGGTGDVVQAAISAGKMVLWFDPQGNGPYLLSADKRENFNARAMAAQTHRPLDRGQLEALMDWLCAPPFSKEDIYTVGDRRRESLRRLKRFFRERERRWHIFAFWYPLLLSVFAGWRGFWRSFHGAPYLDTTRNAWRSYFFAIADLDENLSRQMSNVVVPRYAWADRLADYYGRQHRSGYISNYIMAAAAICFAALMAVGIFGTDLSAIGELGALQIIMCTTYLGRFRNWRTRWLDYRILSAHLLALRGLVLTGSAPSYSEPPPADAPIDPGRTWANWYCRMTVREIGLPNLTINSGSLRQIRSAIQQAEIQDQIGYHKINARRMAQVDHWLDRLGSAAFFLAALVALFFAASPFLAIEIQRPLLLPAIMLPVLGVILYALRVQGDFFGAAERSRKMAENLSTLAFRLSDSEEASLASLSALNELAVLMMANELGISENVYNVRPLALPAY